MIHDQLKAVTARMPCKTIPINGHDYLRRYYAGTQRSGRDVWLHEFLSADGERHLHNHPFTARSIILSGGYTEELPGYQEDHQPNPVAGVIVRVLEAGQVPETADIGRHMAAADHWHRIARVRPHTWTMMIVEPHRLPHWYFRDDDGTTVQMDSSPRDWWLAYPTRDNLQPSWPQV